MCDCLQFYQQHIFSLAFRFQSNKPQYYFPCKIQSATSAWSFTDTLLLIPFDSTAPGTQCGHMDKQGFSLDSRVKVYSEKTLYICCLLTVFKLKLVPQFLNRRLQFYIRNKFNISSVRDSLYIKQCRCVDRTLYSWQSFAISELAQYLTSQPHRFHYTKTTLQAVFNSLDII